MTGMAWTLRGVRCFSVFPVIAMSLATLFLGCYMPPDPLPITLARARTIISQNVVSQAASLDAGLQFLEAVPLFQRLGGYLGGGFACTVAADGTDGSRARTTTGAHLLRVSNCEFEMGEDSFKVGIEGLAGRLVKVINEFVLVDSQVAQYSDTHIELALKPDVFCNVLGDIDGGGEGDGGGDVPGNWSGLEARDIDIGFGDGFGDLADACREFLGIVPVKLSLVSYYQDSLDIDVQVGEYRVLALQFRTYSEMTSVSFDLYQMKSALDAANALYGIQGGSLYDSLDASGWISAWISNDYYGVPQIGLSISDNTTARMTLGGDEISFHSDAVAASLSAGTDGSTATLAIDAGRFDIEFPYQMLIDWWWGHSGDSMEPSGAGGIPEVLGTVTVRGDGLALLARTVGEIGVAIEQLDMKKGAFQVSRDFDSILGIRLLPASTQSLQAMIVTSEELNPTVTVNSGAGIVLDWNLHEIAAGIPEVPSGTEDCAWSISFEGNAPAFTILDGRHQQWLRMQSGQMVISSDGPTGGSVSVGSGMCLAISGDTAAPEVPDETYGDMTAFEAMDASETDDHVLLSAVGAVTCAN